MTMVRIISYKTRQKEDGTDFYLLEVQGGIEMVLSKTSGQYYATAKKATVSTFLPQLSSFASRNPGLFNAIMLVSGGLSGGASSAIIGGKFY
jgi:hypothetical protein